MTDTCTGFMWTYNQVHRPDRSSLFTYDEAVAVVDALVQDGYDDWRLPTLEEMRVMTTPEIRDPTAFHAGTNYRIRGWTTTTETSSGYPIVYYGADTWDIVRPPDEQSHRVIAVRDAN